MIFGLNKVLAFQRLVKLIEQIPDIRSYQRSPWADRVRPIAASEDEVIYQGSGTISVADVIVDDAAAPVKRGNVMTPVTYKVPNIKHGYNLGQAALALLYRISQNSYLPSDLTSIDRQLLRHFTALIEGVEKREALMVVGMLTGGISYDRFGVKINSTFNMPANLKVALTGGAQWTLANAATCTPFANIRALVRIGQETYGTTYDRLTLSTALFDAMVASDEFKERSQALNFPAGFNYGTLPTSDQLSLVARLLSPGQTSEVANQQRMVVEIDDAACFVETEAGGQTSTRYTPENVAILSNRAMDGNVNAADFARVPPVEALVASLAPGSIIGDGIPPDALGPIAYATLSSPGLNPPGVTLWAVDRGIPRRHMLGLTATITAA